MRKQVALFIVTVLGFPLFGHQLIVPLPENVAYDPAKAALGKALFSDTILSRDETVACVSCHSFEHGGADPRPVSFGIKGRKGNIQSPTVYNARFNFKQFWNGRAESLTEQADGPIHNPSEMAIDHDSVVTRLNRSPHYPAQFERIYGPGPITYAKVIDAIVEFEMALVTPDSKFDRYLRHEVTLSPLEAEGYRRFKEYGCTTCHNGINIGGNSFQKMGLFVPYHFDAKVPDRYAVTKKEKYKNVYKVPTLRNIALTAPYFHDASSPTLEDAVKKMSHYNLGNEMRDEDVNAIVAFLKTLTGEPPAILQ